MKRFVNRKRELEILKKEWEKKRASFVVIYGRRRIGKTELLKFFVKGKDGIFFIAEDVRKEIIIEEMKEKFADFFKDDLLKNLDIKNWKQFFDYLAKIFPKDKRFYIVLDEFTYIVKNSPEILSYLQKFWDDFMKKTKVFFVICGSLFGMMEEKVLSESSPLYGRRTRDLLIRPMKFSDAIEFLRDMNFEDCLKTYLTVGGVPKYLEIAGEYKRYSEFVHSEFLDKDGFFYREPYFILSQEFKEYRTYLSILNAISFGNTEPTKIANFVGIKAREIYPYLDDLISRAFVKRVGNVLNERVGIYLIYDVFFDFWFNFVYKNREKIELEIMDLKGLNFDQYFGKRFEIFVRDEIFPKVFSVEKFGKFWSKDFDVDILGMGKDKLIICEVKWNKKLDPTETLRKMVENLKKIPIKSKNIELVIFSRGFKRKVESSNGFRVYCFDMDDLRRIIMQ